MNIILFTLRWIALAILLWSGSAVMGRVLHLKPCFSPVVTLCSITMVVYYGGLLGALAPVTYGMIALCLCCLGYEVSHRRGKKFVLRELPVIQGFFLIGLFAFGGILSQGSLVHYDNFTHWGTVVKEMLITGAFPTADSTLIEFSNYPTGAASWIYFVCTVVGHGENSMVMAQGLMIFAALYAVFGIIAERGRFLLVVTLGTGMSLLTLFNFSIRINNLLVDFLLPVLSLAAIALIYRHRVYPNTLLISIVPILGVLVVVKSTGIIFAGVAILYLVYNVVEYALHSRCKWISLYSKMVGSIALCVLPLIGWNLRMAYVFAGVTNKFETDITALESGFGGKTGEEITQICNLFFSTITDLSERSTMGIVLFQLLAIIACVIGCGVMKRNWALPTVLVAMDIVLVAYLAGILAMYIFSMPMEEASYLAAFDRYSSSIVVLFGGVLSMCFTVDMEKSFYYRLGEVDDVRSFKSIETKSIYLKSCIVCVVVISIILTSEYNGMCYQENVDKGGMSHSVKAVVGDNWSSEINDNRYLLIADDSEGMVTNYYLHYVARYYLRADNVDAICLFYEDNFLNLLSQYDYLVIVDSSTYTKSLMQKYFGLSGDVGVYDLSAL